MKRFVPFILLVAFLAFSAYAAGPDSVAPDGAASPLKIRQLVKTADGLQLDLGIEAPVWSNAGTADAPVQVAEIISGGQLEEDGYPTVPIAGAMFRIPPNAGVVVEVLDAEYETYTDVEYAAFFGVSEADQLGPTQHPEDVWYPGTLAEAGEPAGFHDFRVTNLITYPVQVNTARREVRVYNSIQVAISFEGTDNRNTIPAWPTRISAAYIPWYRTFLDWDENELDDYEVYHGAVQVVCRDNASLWTELEPWIEWKQQMGWDLEFLTQNDAPGFTATSIKNELQSRWNTQPFDYIVVVGDDQGSFPVPPGTGSGYGAGDLGYTQLVGNDYLPDVGLGRITAETYTQLAAYVSKVLNYERDVDLNDTDWYLRGAVSASASSSGTSTIYTGRYCMHAMLNIGYTEVDTAWYTEYGYNVPAQDIIHINNGVSFYSHRGWLGTGLTTTEIANLNNDFETPMVVDITCGTGNWSQSYGINEAWMRSGTVNAPRGGIGAIGTATSSTHTRFNNTLTGGAAQSMLVLRNPAMGDMIMGAKLNLWNNFHIGDPADMNNFMKWCNLMGDPTVWLWTGVPKEFDVTANAQFELGSSSYSVLVEDLTTGQPVEDAWVTLYKSDANEEVIFRGYTGSDGTVILNLQLQYTGDMMLTVAKQHYVAYQQTIPVVNPNTLLGIYDLTFLDDGTNGTSGNGNGIPEAGERIGFQVTCKNFSSGVGSSRHNVSLSISCTDPWVENITGTISYGTMDANEINSGTGIVLVDISSQAQHGWILPFQLSFTSDEGTDVHVQNVSVTSVKFSLNNLYWSAGSPDPGETKSFTVRVNNIGGSDAIGFFTGTLVSNSPWLTVTQASATFPTIPAGSNGLSTDFTVMASPQAIGGTDVTTQLVMETVTGLVDTMDVVITIGSRSSTDPTGPDSYGYYAFDNTDTGYGSYAPTYDWVEINPSAAGNDYNGTNLNQGDDDADVVNLPFDIQYYGETFSQLTITSNGFVAMGSQADMKDQRNQVIPSPLGPNGMVAPYWDDRLPSGTDNVYYYYNAANHRFIVEWYRVDDINGSNPCTFEVIFYDQVGEHVTSTGDAMILFQYNTMNHSTGAYADVPYWTTGIENNDQTSGLLYYFWNMASPGAASIQNGRAIMFTPDYTAEPTLELTLIPQNPPIVIPAGGGTFYVDPVLTNHTDSPITFDAWIVIILPNGNEYGPVLRVDNRTIPANYTMYPNTLSQYVPASAPAGNYSYVGKLGEYPNVIYAMDSVPFTKEAGVGAANHNMGWAAFGWDDDITDGATASDPLPTEFAVERMYPNPFNPTTTMTVALPAEAELSITVYNVIGQQVAILANGRYSEGYHSFTFNGSGLASGIYFVKAVVPGQMDEMRKITLLR